jgi:hypothetical protein
VDILLTGRNSFQAFRDLCIPNIPAVRLEEHYFFPLPRGEQRRTLVHAWDHVGFAYRSLVLFDFDEAAVNIECLLEGRIV